MTKCVRERLVAAPDRNGVKASEIVGNGQRDVDSPVCTNGQLRDLVVLRANPPPETRLPDCVSQTSDTSVFAGRPLPLSDARVSTGPWLGLILRLPPPLAGGAAGTRLLLIWLCERRGGDVPWRDAEHESGSRQMRVWRLLVIQIALTHVPGVELYLMLADGARLRGTRQQTRPRVSVAETHPTSWLSQFTTHVLSSVRHPSPLTRISIGVPTGPSVGCISNVWLHRPRPGQGHAVFREEHFVNAAIVFGNLEGIDARPSEPTCTCARVPGCIGEALPRKR